MLADLNNLAQALQAEGTVKVVVFQSAHPEIFVAHADIEFLKDMSGKAVSRNEVKLLDLQVVLERISKLPQATIAKIEGFARGGGHEFALACDMRFAPRGKAKFMQMEVGMGILPCGGASRMARQVGLGRALEIVLGARDFDADEAERVGTKNRALDADEIGPFVEDLAKRIAPWPSESINATKQAVHESIDRSKKRLAQKLTGCIRQPAKRRPSNAANGLTIKARSSIWTTSAPGRTCLSRSRISKNERQVISG